MNGFFECQVSVYRALKNGIEEDARASGQSRSGSEVLIPRGWPLEGMARQNI